MEKSLRDYQIDAINSVMNQLKAGNRSLYLKCGTGGGKTFVAKSIIDLCHKHRNDYKILFVVPKNILIEQTMKEFGDCGIYNAEYGKRELHKRITIGSSQSLSSEKSIPHFDLVFFDEVHRAKGQHEKLLKKIRLENPRSILIGLTATDYVLNENLNMIKACDFGLRYLTDQGYLSPLVILPGEDKLDIDSLKAQGDGYRQKEVDEQLEHKIDKQVSDMLIKSKDRNKVIIMCTTIDHAERVAEIIGDCQLYHSKMKRDDRMAELNLWKRFGKYLVSVIAASEGFDFPPADCLVLFRPTRSPTLYEQACGRIARLHPSKKDGLILDYGGVIDSLGLPYDINIKKKGSSKDYKECKQCGVANRLDAVYCSCGNAFTHNCQGCGKILLFGEGCCAKKIDRFKNLTDKAFTGGDDFKKLGKITLHEHISRKGNRCLKVCWWRNDFNCLVAEYFMWKNSDFKIFSHAIFGETPDNPLDLIGMKIKNMPKKVMVKKIDGYDKVVSLKFY